MISRAFVACAIAAGITWCLVACVADGPAVTADGTKNDAATSGDDASTESDGGSDAASSPCDLDAPWQTPTPLNSVNSPLNDQRPALSADELTIYLSSRRVEDGGTDGGSSVSRIFVAKRADKNTDTFTTPVALSDVINAPGTESIGSSLSNDRRRLYFTARGGALPEYTIVEATRSAVNNDSWLDATRKVVGVGATGTSEFSPFLASDGSLYYARSGSPPNFEIVHAIPDGSGGFLTPEVVAELSSEQDDSDPTISPDGLTIYFSSARMGSEDTDIWKATRGSTAATFGVPTRVAELSSTARDVPGWISPDGCRIYITSTRPGGPGQIDVFVSSKPAR